MKGVVFTEFLDMVEERYSADFVDDIIERCNLESEGAYTSVGTYGHREFITLLSVMSERTDHEIGELMRAFGEHLFTRFSASYPEFFTDSDDALVFLRCVEDYIHVEVRKLYPEAELPTFEYGGVSRTSLQMTYRSKRPFAPLAEGLIKGCVSHFGEDVSLHVEDLSAGAGTAAKFTLTKHRELHRAP